MSTKTYRDSRVDNVSVTSGLQLPSLVGANYPSSNGMLYFSPTDECLKFTKGAPSVSLVPAVDLRIIRSSTLTTSPTQTSLVYTQHGSMCTLVVENPLTEIDMSQDPLPGDYIISTLMLASTKQTPCTVILPRGSFVLHPSHSRVSFQWMDGQAQIIDETTSADSGVPVWGPSTTYVAGDATVGVAGQYHNISSSMSGDGLTLVIGDPLGTVGSAVGQARVFTRSTTDATFTLLQTLVGTGNTGNSSQGIGVAISGNGRYIAVAGPGNNSGFGAVWTFLLGADGLYAQNSMTVPSQTSASSFGGILARPGNIAMSGDGSYLIVGASLAAGGGSARGSIYLFNVGVSTSTEVVRLSGVADNDSIGPVVISADGRFFATISTGSGTNKNKVYVFYNSPTILTSPTELVSTYSISTISLGGSATTYPWSIAMSASGKRIVVGKPQYNGAGTRGVVVVYDMSLFSLGSQIFVANSTTFALTSVLGSFTPSIAADAGEGAYVAISGDGKTVLVGAPGMDAPNTNCGNVFVWRDNIGEWNLGSVLTGTTTSTAYGTTVACSSSAFSVVATPAISSGTAGTLLWE